MQCINKLYLYQSDGEHWRGFWWRQAHTTVKRISFCHLDKIISHVILTILYCILMINCIKTKTLCDSFQCYKCSLIRESVRQHSQKEKLNFNISYFVPKPEMLIYLYYKYECIHVLFTMCPHLLSHCSWVLPLVSDSTWSVSVQVMVSLLFSAKPLSELMLTYCRLEPQKQK